MDILDSNLGITVNGRTKKEQPLLVSGLVGLIVLGICSCTQDDNVASNDSRYMSPNLDYEHSIAIQFISLVENSISQGLVEGVQFSIIEDGELLLAQGFGLADRETNRPMTADTPINVASLSKSFTAWGVLALSEHNDIDLDSSINNYLNSYQLTSEDYADADVTIGMLLSHTSGLSTPSVPVTPVTEPIPELTNILLGGSSVPRAEIERRPGSGYVYSGAGYLLLQKMIEDQTGSTFANYMTETVLEPSGMSNSAFSLSPDIVRRAAIYYRRDGRRREPYHLPGAAGALYTTANDMARFIILYTDKGRLSRSQIIPENQFVTMLVPVTPVQISGVNVGTTRYALGHNTYETPEGIKIVFHAGGNPGLRALYIVALDGNDGFFAVVNDDRGAELLAEMMRIWGGYYSLTLHPYF